MAMTMIRESSTLDGRSVGGARRQAVTPGVEYRLLYAVVFVVCFALAALLRLAPRRWHPWIASSERPMSLAAEARVATDATVPYVFQVA